MSTPTSRPGDRRPDDAATRELIGAWAVDALDPAERALVEDLLARDPDAAREARSLQETAAVLGAAVAVPAPEDVRAAVLAAVARTAQEAGDAAAPARPHTAPAHAAPSRPSTSSTSSTSGPPAAGTRPAGRSARRPRRRWLTAVAAVAVAFAVALPSTIAWRESQRAAEAQARADRLTTLLAEPGAQVLASEVTTGGTAVAVVTEASALVTATGLDRPGAGEVYQLWVMQDGVPVPDATTGTSDGTLEISTDAYRAGDALALTVEPEGGSAAPTTEPVVVLAPA
ncbi:anti-sigma factor [Cellulomonas sp. Marseille-Q8402]